MGEPIHLAAYGTGVAGVTTFVLRARPKKSFPVGVFTLHQDDIPNLIAELKWWLGDDEEGE
jgi:hypothetical protein